MLVECPHCEGKGVCQDDYHQDTFPAAAKEMFGSDKKECPSGCDGGPYHPGECTHCEGRGSIDESLL